MSIIIELPSETQSRLQELAARVGQEPANFVLIAIEEKLLRLETPSSSAAPSLATTLAGLTGTIRSNDGRGGSRLSEQSGQDFAQDLAQKHERESL